VTLGINYVEDLGEKLFIREQELSVAVDLVEFERGVLDSGGQATPLFERLRDNIVQYVDQARLLLASCSAIAPFSECLLEQVVENDAAHSVQAHCFVDFDEAGFVYVLKEGDSRRFLIGPSELDRLERHWRANGVHAENPVPCLSYLGQLLLVQFQVDILNIFFIVSSLTHF
jgi:hypothetical protein